LDYIILPTGLPVSNINVPEMTYYCVWWDIKQLLAQTFKHAGLSICA